MNRSEYIVKVGIAEEAARNYYGGTVESALSDNEYDSLVEQLKTAGEANGWYEHVPLVEEVAAGVLRVDTAVEGRQNRMLSLEKITTTTALSRFLSRFPAGAKVVYEPKLDGFALSAFYKDGKLASLNTRGDGERGDNILGTVLRNTSIENLPYVIAYKGDLEVRGEVYVTSEGLRESNIVRVNNGDAPYSLERSAAAGAVRSLTPVRYVPLKFTTYDVFSDESFGSCTETMGWVRELGFRTPSDAVNINTEGLTPEQIVDEFGKSVPSLGVPVDGLVLKADDYSIREKLGEGSRHPYWAAAFKYPSLVVQTVFREVRREVGKTGAVSYRLEVDPVEINGSVVSRATGNNAEFIDNLDLHIGDTVLLRKANEIIPEVLGVVKALRPEGAVKYVAPTTCPKCGEQLDTTSSVVWRCENYECVVFERIVHATSRQCLDIEGLSRARVELLVEEELIRTPADLFYLTEETLANLKTGYVKEDGDEAVVGPTVAKTISQSIENARNKAPLMKVLASLGIRNLGQTLSKHLANTYRDIDTILALSLSDFTGMVVRGRRLGESNGTRIYESLRKNREVLQRMKQAGVKSLNEKTEEVVREAKLAGESVVVSGSVPGYTRDTVKELIESLGGVASGSVSKNTTLLVTDPDSTSSKAVKARQLGVKIVSAEDFLASIM